MNTTENENSDSTNTEAEEVVATIEGESAEDKAVRLEGLNAQLFERAKKAEGFEKIDGKWIKKQKPAEVKPIEQTETSKDSLSPTDIYVLIEGKVPKEDINEVTEYAKFKNISIAEALNSPVLKGILAEKVEQRNVANGTNTGGSNRGSTKLSDSALLANADKGILPESDEDMKRLTLLQRSKK